MKFIYNQTALLWLVYCFLHSTEVKYIGISNKSPWLLSYLRLLLHLNFLFSFLFLSRSCTRASHYDNVRFWNRNWSLNTSWLIISLLLGLTADSLLSFEPQFILVPGQRRVLMIWGLSLLHHAVLLVISFSSFVTTELHLL